MSESQKNRGRKRKRNRENSKKRQGKKRAKTQQDHQTWSLVQDDIKQTQDDDVKKPNRLFSTANHLLIKKLLDEAKAVNSCELNIKFIEDNTIILDPPKQTTDYIAVDQASFIKALQRFKSYRELEIVDNKNCSLSIIVKTATTWLEQKLDYQGHQIDGKSLHDKEKTIIPVNIEVVDFIDRELKQWILHTEGLEDTIQFTAEPTRLSVFVQDCSHIKVIIGFLNKAVFDRPFQVLCKERVLVDIVEKSKLYHSKCRELLLQLSHNDTCNIILDYVTLFDFVLTEEENYVHYPTSFGQVYIPLQALEYDSFNPYRDDDEAYKLNLMEEDVTKMIEYLSEDRLEWNVCKVKVDGVLIKLTREKHVDRDDEEGQCYVTIDETNLTVISTLSENSRPYDNEICVRLSTFLSILRCQRNQPSCSLFLEPNGPLALKSLTRYSYLAPLSND